MKRAAMDSCLLLLFMCASILSTPVSPSFLGFGSEYNPEGPDHEMKFEPRQPESIFESDGAKFTPPQYANSHRVLVVISGCAYMGLILPMGTKANIRKISKGEVIAVPRGMPIYMYNDGEEPCTFLTFANIRSPMIHGRHRYEAFHLSGARTENKMGGIMHGFSQDMFMEAMDLDKQTMRQWLENQDGVAIVKMSREQRPSRKEFGKEEAEIEGGGLMADFGYHLEKAHRDIVHPQAGQLTVVNGYKLPVLKAFGHVDWVLEAAEKSIEGSRMAHQCRPYDLLCSRICSCSGDEGFDAALVMNSHMPISMHLTGKDSVFNMMRPEVRMGTFKISKELDKRVHEESSRRHTAILLPPRGRAPRDGQLGDEDEALRENGGVVAAGSSSTMDDVREAIWSMFEVA
ncbi:hypothetical protein GOP47_0018973 [Adiantum capillus-veneris]|uniref:Cupin type-1 domain-containing protein n=1 Tax=Adiantum capillus-veneris TaxID=13818 RepID=A0A9D4UE78_ADICA|nr:hypothetical protein GOP47_0018973 [Adiantum capillus-veneris]